jgi:hypothetical protein
MDEVIRRVPKWFTDGDGSRHADEESVSADDATALVDWLNISWQPTRDAGLIRRYT